jgi:O-antigen ligase
MGNHKSTRRGDSPATDSPFRDRLRPCLLAAAVALWVCRPLWASEGAALYGDGLPVVMSWIALVVFWLLGAIGRRELTLRFAWIDLAVLLLVGFHSLSAGLGGTHGNPRPAANVLWEWVGMGLAYFAARQWIADRREARAVLVAMLALAATLSLYGLYQRFYEFAETRAVYASNPDSALRSAGVWLAPGSAQRELLENRLRCNEPLATFALTNSLAGLLAAWFTVAIGIGLWSSHNRRVWFAVAVVAVPITTCLLLTKSRSGYIAALTGLGALAIVLRGWPLRGRRVLAALAGTLLLLAAAVGIAFAVDHQIAAKAVKSLGYRFQYWQATWHMITDHPVVGCGPGSFQDAYTRYKLPEASEEVADPHNFLLEVWATAGAPAAVALLGVLGGLIATALGAVRGARSATSPHEKPSHGNLLDPEQAKPLWLRSVAVVAGAIVGYPLAVVASMASPSPPGYGVLLTGMLVTAAVFWAFSAWIDSGRLPTVLPAIAACALLIHLLAAGGISYAGVAGSFWLLAAIAINLAGRDRPLDLGRPAIWVILVAALLLAGACQLTGYSPVLRARAAMSRAEQLPPDSPDAVATLQRAVEADPWAAPPLEKLADLEFHAWLRLDDSARFRQFEWYRDRAVALSPRSSSAWQVSGDYYLRAYEKTHLTAQAQKAAQAFTRAVDLYPTSALCHAKLAIALRAVGDAEGFRRESARALEFDRRTPHADKKLPSELRRAVQDASSSPTEQPPRTPTQK